MIRPARFHAGRHLERLMHPAEVVEAEVQVHRRFQVLDLLAEGIRQPGEAGEAMRMVRLPRSTCDARIKSSAGFPAIFSLTIAARPLLRALRVPGPVHRSLMRVARRVG